MTYSPDKLSVSPISHRPNSVLSEQSVQLGGLPIKLEGNSPIVTMSSASLNSPFQQQSFEGVSNQNMSFGSDSKTFIPNYTNLTAWTTKVANQGSESLLSPPSSDAMSVPMMSSLQPCFPVSTGPIHLTSRTHKSTPYHNAFSAMRPLQPHTAKLSQTNVNSTHSMAAVLPMNSSSAAMKLKSISSRENRFKKTAEALHKSGLWEIAMKTGNLIKRNQELQKELEQFKMDALNFLKSVIKNPKNRDFIKTVLNNALSAGGTEHKKSVMTVVVSAAAHAAASVNSEQSSTMDSSDGKDSQSISSSQGSNLTSHSNNIESSVSDMSSSISMNDSVSNSDLSYSI